MDIKKLDNSRLLAEYKDLRKHSFNSMFGHNARVAMNAAVDELFARGITMEPNIFGDMPIRKWDHA